MLDTARDAGQTGPLLAHRSPAMASGSVGTVISRNPIPLTAVFKFSMGSPAKPGNTTIRAPIPKKAAPSTPKKCAIRPSIRTPFPLRAAFQRSSGWRVHYFAPDTTKLRPVRLFSNIRIYERIGGLYDASLGFWSREVCRQAAGALDLREDERLLTLGVGTGMELEFLEPLLSISLEADYGSALVSATENAPQLPKLLH